ncbi:hypothetical protein BGHDH14_bghG003977000002001 [Blumeria hordei DH14]|uniref:Uncharacterized protein n=1 Tax=Blumeria graminis f. sp. hordei (strain DH14) TaxID=546991 RepID=N1JIR7_BLUG1|nr:hypothetical protein BGHDH14_bghG003977000002001 [Blumeria hordei DH14]
MTKLIHTCRYTEDEVPPKTGVEAAQVIAKQEPVTQPSVKIEAPFSQSGQNGGDIEQTFKDERDLVSEVEFNLNSSAVGNCFDSSVDAHGPGIKEDGEIFGQRVTTTCYKGDSGNEEDIKRAEDVEERACRIF